MDILEQIIQNLTSDEVRRFKILSNRFKADEEKKLLILFDAIRAGNYESVEDSIIEQLYGDIGANAKNNYYRLRNKLLNNVEKSVLFYHFNYKNAIESHSNLQLAALLTERGLYRESYYYLKKAEKLAYQNDQFHLLEVVFDEIIRLALKHIDVDIESILKKQQENRRKLEMQRKINEVLALVSQQMIKRNFSRAKKNDSVIGILEEAQKLLESHQDVFQSVAGKLLIFRTIRTILIQKGAYSELEKYTKEILEGFETQKAFTRENHSDRLMIRISRIHALRKLLNIKQEKSEIEKLAEELEMYHRQNYQEYVVYYYNAKINNQKLLGDLEGASVTLKNALQHKEILQNNLNELIFMISLADQYFCQNLYIHAIDTLQKLKTHKKFAQLSDEIRYYLVIFEMICQFEAKNYGQITHLFQAIKTEFKAIWKDESYDRSHKLVEILMRMTQAAIDGKKTFIKSAYKSFLEEYGSSEVSDNHIIMYELYLQSKVEEKEYYTLLCEFVGKK